MRFWKSLFPSKRRRPRSAARPKSYSAVKIQYSRQVACFAVISQTDQVYLSAEAPLLPLPACDCSHQCRCRYIHLPDRRSGPRRDADLGLGSRYVSHDRRWQGDRRRRRAA